MPKLSVDQGPPLSIPMSFFFTAPTALFAAGLLLLFRVDDGIVTSFAPSNVAVLHLGTLGFLLFTVAGALYQLLPVVAGAVVPFVRLAHGAHLLLLAGTGALVTGQWRLDAELFRWGSGLMGLGLICWLAPSMVALVRSRVVHPTAIGLRLSVAVLLGLVTLGLRMALLRAGLDVGGDWLTLRSCHAALGLVVFAGGIVASVSWQVVPMFFLAAPPPAWHPRAVMGGVAVSFVALMSLSFYAAPSWAIALAVGPAAFGTWLLQPLWLFKALRSRKRRRTDATLMGWWASVALSPLSFLLGIWVIGTDDPTPSMVFGVLVLWGQTGLVVHAMLTRIVPFLAYLHWSAPLVATHRMRSAKELLPDREVKAGALLHGGSVCVGLAAAALGSMPLWRFFGGCLLAVSGFLFFELIATLMRSRAPLARR